MKQVSPNCTQCKREKAKGYAKAPTASLHHFRVNPAKPFSLPCLDFAGPFCIKTSEGMKMYILLHSCAVTRAVHLELIEDQAAMTFIQALRKFSARRYRRENSERQCKNLQGNSTMTKRITETQESPTVLLPEKLCMEVQFTPGPMVGRILEETCRISQELSQKSVGAIEAEFLQN